MKQLLILLVLVMLMPGVAFSQSTKFNGDFTTIQTPPKPNSLEVVVFDEYLNFTCPHCNNFRKAAKALKEKYKKSLKINYIPVLFRNQSDFPLRLFFIAQAKNKTEEVKELLFDTAFEHNVNIYDPTVVSYLARVSGLSEAYNKEGNADWVTQRIHASRAKALDTGVDSTPTVILANSMVVKPKMGMNTFVANLETLILQLVKK